MYEQLGRQSRKGGEDGRFSSVTAKGGGRVTQGSKVGWWRVEERERGRKSVDPAFTVSGYHLFTQSTACVVPVMFSEKRQLHNVSSDHG